jgi:hypothetical protein
VQIRSFSEGVTCRETSRVSALMCPFCVRGVLSTPATPTPIDRARLPVRGVGRQDCDYTATTNVPQRLGSQRANARRVVRARGATWRG